MMLRCVRAASSAQRLQRSSLRSVQTRRPISSQAAAEPPRPLLHPDICTKGHLFAVGLGLTSFAALGWSMSGGDFT
jgi:hypothetical protein